MFRLQNHLLNMNMTKFQVTYQEKDCVLTLGHLTILVYRFFFQKDLGRTCKSIKRYYQCPLIYSNHFFKYFCHSTHDVLASYYLGYCVKFKFKSKEKFL